MNHKLCAPDRTKGHSWRFCDSRNTEGDETIKFVLRVAQEKRPESHEIQALGTTNELKFDGTVPIRS